MGTTGHAQATTRPGCLFPSAEIRIELPGGSTSKYDFRCFLLRLGLIGPEFKTARLHLLANLSGSAAWKGERRDGAAR